MTKFAPRLVGFLLSLSLSTVGLPSGASAYSENTTKSGRVIRWSDTAVALRTDAAFDRFLSESESRDALTIAVEAWRGFGDAPDVLLRDGEAAPVGYARGSADNSVTALEDWPYESEKLAVTVITYEQDTGRLLDADILVNASSPYMLADPDEPTNHAYDLAAVLTHEVGHLLGLGENTDDARATMWPYAAPGDTHQRTISEDDEASVIHAYSQPLPQSAAGCGQARVLGARASATRHGLLWLIALAAVLLRARRPGRRLRAAGLATLVLWLSATSPSTGQADRETLSPQHHAHGGGGAIAAGSAAAQARLRALTGDPARLAMGTVQRGKASWRDGRLSTAYTLRTADGTQHAFTVRGGVVDGVVQRLAEQPLPAEGARVALAMDTLRWAFSDGDTLHGGALGIGPPVGLR